MSEHQVLVALTAYRQAIASLSNHQAPARARAQALRKAHQQIEALPLPPTLPLAEEALRTLFTDCSDIVFRPFRLGGKQPGLIVYIDGLADTVSIEQSLLEPALRANLPKGAAQAGLGWLVTSVAEVAQVRAIGHIGEAVGQLLAGQAVVLIDGLAEGISLDLPGWKQRAIEEPPSEPPLRGPREGFVETLRVNISLIRRRIKSPLLKTEQLTIGLRSQTTLNLLYLQDVAKPALVTEIKQRLKQVEILEVISTGRFEELLDEQPLSPFPRLFTTERPDRVVASLLEGQLALVADGSPMVAILPVTLWSLMNASEDYYFHFIIGTFTRWLRYFFTLGSVIIPAVYVAITTYHQEMLPTPLMLSLVNAREGVPFPSLVETLFMMIFFEALREAGLRLPRTMGQTISIVGALVIGEAAVNAGLVSAPVVMVVAATGISAFTVPSYSLESALRLFRLPLAIAAGTLGLFGLTLGLLAILVHLCTLRSFGIPYLAPFAPVRWTDLKDTLVRIPVWRKDRRPKAYEPLDQTAPTKRPNPGGAQ